MQKFNSGDRNGAINQVFNALALMGKATPYGRVASLLMASRDARSFSGAIMTLMNSAPASGGGHGGSQSSGGGHGGGSHSSGGGQGGQYSSGGGQGGQYGGGGGQGGQYAGGNGQGGSYY
ncbi:hypothetical protein VFPBJ_00375 [Purpureocillium lilacinum]|uniref:Uncharacterized protein n=1 Tax=Purpureocillium lilacinum TaxID=33203 RepID=A0A179H7X8_PURLI|nr:hypothetical protein VFPBJ_00375 [Purpureocillium lilacinum]